MSNVTYRLPDTLSGDISKFAFLAKEYEAKKISATEFKAFRVPMGVYEQRKDEVYMVRVRATGGVIYPSQLLQLIAIARTHGSDLLHLTTRQEIQIHNLPLHEVDSVLRELQAVGLATKGGGGNTVRNIMVSEFSGIGTETFDATPYAMELTSRLLAEPDSYLLPRKLKIAFSSDKRNIDYAAINDIGLVAKEQSGERGFEVYVGGGGGAKPTTGWLLFDFLPVQYIHTLVRALKRFFSEYGNRKNRSQARLRFIFYKLGEEETLRLIREFYEKEKEESVLDVIGADINERPSYVYRQRQMDRQGDGEYRLWKKRYVRSQRQEGYCSVLFPIILGDIRLNEIRVSRLEKLLAFLHIFGEHTLRFTSTQNIRFRNIPEPALPELYLLLKDFTDETGVPFIANNIVSCTGADTCRLGICLSKGLSTAIREELLRSKLDLDQLDDVTIHVAGCPNSCGQQIWSDLGFAGRVLRNDRVYPGYQFFLAASRKENPSLSQPAGNLAARDVPRFVCRLLEGYLKGSCGGSFSDYLRAESNGKVRSLLSEYSNIPAFADDKSYYSDWGAEDIFSKGSRGKAECASGLFDMIKVDQDSISWNKKALEDETDCIKRMKLVYGIVFSASRMLLVTRGADPQNDIEVFDSFLKLFVEEGYISGKYTSLIRLAADHPTADFTAWEQEAYALADAVMELYKDMDESLQFKRPPGMQEPLEETTVNAHGIHFEKKRTKDLRGLICPMNFVKTKLELASMRSGELLEVWLDDGHPIENVPDSIRGEGHSVISQEPVENYWRVIIRKK